MANQNHNHGGMGMMWMMMIGCMLPLLLLSLFARDSGNFPRWVIPVAIVAMFGLHFVVMRHHHSKTPDQSSKTGVDDTHDHHQPPQGQAPQSGV